MTGSNLFDNAYKKRAKDLSTIHMRIYKNK